MVPTRRRAFTLVELLVVVAIVTLLVSILLPVLALARERAAAIQCASNIRQVTTAMAAYETVYGAYPIDISPGYGLSFMIGDHPVHKTWVDALLDGRFLVGPDLGRLQFGVLGCPSVDDARRQPDRVRQWTNHCPDYSYNSYVFPSHSVGFPRMTADRYFQGRRGRMAKDGGTRVLMTEAWRHDTWTDGTTIINTDVGYGMLLCSGGDWAGTHGTFFDLRHMRGRALNVAYMAGHVELLYPPPFEGDPYVNHPLALRHFIYADMFEPPQPVRLQ